MPHIKKVIQAGPVIETEHTYSCRYGKKGGKRGSKEKLSTLAMEKINYKKAEDHLRRTLYQNFRPGDWHIVLTYRPSDRPDVKQSKKLLDKFLRDLRKHFRKVLKKELRYIAVTEFKSKNIHHHVVIEGIDIRPLRKLWECGTVRGTPIANYEHISCLAGYLIKETDKTFREKKGGFKKRWNSSKNLKQYETKVTVLKADRWSKNPKPVQIIKKKTYYLDKHVGDGSGVRNYIQGETEFPCQFFRLMPMDLKDQTEPEGEEWFDEWIE